MILFEKDFLTQRSIIHYSTKNKSAIYMAKLLKKMGVKNNKFHLALTQPELIDVDPYDPRITQEMRDRIVYECKINPWYYYREIVRVSAQGTEGIPFEFNRANLCLIWIIYNSINILLIIPRQTGKTMGVQAIVSHIMYVAGRKYTVGHFAKDQSLVQQNVIRLKEIRDSLPKYLVAKSIKDIDNKEGLSYVALGNSYKTFVAQTDKKAAERQGRGESLPFTHHDEVAWYPNIKLSFPAATGSMGAARPQALKSGLPSCSVLTTTAGRIDDDSGRWTYNFMNNCKRFHESMYDAANHSSLMELITENGNTGSVFAEFSYKQLGKSEEWFTENTSIGKDKDTIDMDYLNKWLSGKEGKALPTELLEALFILDPIYYEQHDNFIFQWFVPHEERTSETFKQKSFIAGLDFAENVGRDFTTFTMIDVETLAVVCTLRSNTANLISFAMVIVEIIKVFKKILIVPERNNNGSAVIDNMVILLLNAGINPFRVIYNSFVQNMTSENRASFHTLDPMGTDRKYLGFRTGANSRDVLYSASLVLAVQQCKSKIFDVNIINELKGLVFRNNRIDHDINGHDDQVISWLLALYIVYHGKNLDIYNIDISRMLIGVDAIGQTIDPEEKKEQMYLRTRIKELEDQLNMVSPYLRATIENELQDLKRRIDTDIALDMNQVSRVQVEKGESLRDERDNPIALAYGLKQFDELMNAFYQ